MIDEKYVYVCLACGKLFSEEEKCKHTCVPTVNKNKDLFMLSKEFEYWKTKVFHILKVDEETGRLEKCLEVDESDPTLVHIDVLVPVNPYIGIEFVMENLYENDK